MIDKGEAIIFNEIRLFIGFMYYTALIIKYLLYNQPIQYTLFIYFNSLE